MRNFFKPTKRIELMELKDILGFYIGQRVETMTRHYPDKKDKSKKMIGKLMCIDYAMPESHYGVHFDGNDPCDLVNYKQDEIKLILRPLELITEKEDQIDFPNQNRGNRIDEHWYPEGVLWLCQHGFDIFGAHSKGWAIYESELNS